MTQRKRATGFALVDTAFAADAKFVRLARKASDPVDFAAAVGVYFLILTDARRARSPDVTWDDYTEYAAQIEALKAARLLQENGFDQVTFERWAPAYRSPSDGIRTGTNGYAEVRNGTKSTNTSVHINSSHVTNGVGGVGEGAPQTFMRSPRGLHASADDVRRQHEREFDLCKQCGHRRGTHRANHDFQEVAA